MVGSQGWVPRAGPMVGSHGWVPWLGPKVGSHGWEPWSGPKLGPKFGSQSRSFRVLTKALFKTEIKYDLKYPGSGNITGYSILIKKDQSEVMSSSRTFTTSN